MELQNNRKMKKETIEQKEYWDKLEEIMLLHTRMAIIIFWYAPIFTKMGINTRDIKAHFQELIEAYTGEEIYNGEKVDRNNLTLI